jgi:RNA polymerase sigma-70 factor (ECF subfamily)
LQRVSETPALWPLLAAARPEPAASAMALEPALVALVARGRAAWPEIELDAAAFVGFVAARLQPDDGTDLTAALAAVRADDLALVCGCLAGDRAALRAFDSLLARSVDTALGRMGAAPTDRTEIAQVVRTRLLVADGDDEPRLRSYRGRGDLRGFVAAVAMRTYVSSKRGKRDGLTDGDDALERLAGSGDDPALAVLRQRHAADFRAAFQAAVADLDERDRMVLRYSHVDGVPLEALATIYKVGRATAHRWLVKARESLAAAVEARLRAALALSTNEFHSIRRLVQDDLELSLRRVFGSDRGDD